MKISINNIKLTGVASCVPKNTSKISDLYSIFGEKEVERIAQSTGIQSVRIATNNLRASDLCLAASQKLIEELAINKDDIGAIVFISQTPDYIMPATSCILQDRLKLKRDTLAFDINYGCSGYIYGLLQAALLINTGSINKVLLCVGDTISKYLDPKDHKSRLVFGDAGTASIIEQGHDRWDFDIKTDGSGYKNLIIPKENNLDKYLYMDGASIMEFALREVKGVVDSVLESQNRNINDMSAVILHQANNFMLQYLRKKLGINKSIMPIAVDQYGNTGPASIPLTMCAKYSELNPNLDLSLLAGFGVGLSWGAVLLSLSSTKFTKVFEL